MKKQLIEKPFESKFGIVNVGDQVVFVTTGYSHNVSVSKGKYIGYIESEDWHGRSIKKVKLEEECYHHVWYNKEMNTKCAYPTWVQMKDEEFMSKIETRKVPYTRTTTLQLNRIAPLAQNNVSCIDTIKDLI